jgi:hypothetical protein
VDVREVASRVVVEIVRPYEDKYTSRHMAARRWVAEHFGVDAEWLLGTDQAGAAGQSAEDDRAEDPQGELCACGHRLDLHGAPGEPCRGSTDRGDFCGCTFFRSASENAEDQGE